MEQKSREDIGQASGENKAGSEAARTTLLQIYAAFFRVGLLTFGGGIAMLPMLERECVVKHKWASQEHMTEYFAISQCMPGIIAVNVATFVGKEVRGFKGALAAMLGVISPSILVILIIAMLLQNFASYPVVQHAFAGIRVAVCVLMFNAVVKLTRNNVKGWLGITLAVAAFALTVVLDLSPVFPVLGAALAGVIEGLVRRRRT